MPIVEANLACRRLHRSRIHCSEIELARHLRPGHKFFSGRRLRFWQGGARSITESNIVELFFFARTSVPAWTDAIGRPNRAQTGQITAPTGGVLL